MRDVELSGQQRLHAGGVIVDDGDLRRFEVAAPFLPVAAAVGQDAAHAGVEHLGLVAAGSNRVGPVLEAVRHHQHVIVAEHVRQVGVRRLEHDLDLLLAHLHDVLDRLHRAGRARLRAFAAMQVDRVDDVVGVQRLAVAEGDALADVAHPFRRIVAGLERLEQLGLNLVLVVDLDQPVEDAGGDVDHHGVEIGPDIHAVGGAAAGRTDAQVAALHRRLRVAGLRQHAARQRGGDAERRRASHELAPAYAAVGGGQLQLFPLIHARSPSSLSMALSPFSARRRSVGSHGRRQSPVCATLCRTTPPQTIADQSGAMT